MWLPTPPRKRTDNRQNALVACILVRFALHHKLAFVIHFTVASRSSSTTCAAKVSIVATGNESAGGMPPQGVPSVNANCLDGFGVIAGRE